MLIENIFQKFQLDNDSQGKEYITKKDIGNALQNLIGGQNQGFMVSNDDLDIIMGMHDIYGNNKITKEEFYTIFDNDDDINIAKMIQSKITKILKKKENIELSDLERRQKVT